MRIIYLCVFFFISSFVSPFVSMAQAAINLELTRGKNAALPIAIVPFANEQQAIAAGNQTITGVVKNDLQNSGEFHVTTPNASAAMPTNASQVNLEYWRKQGVNDVVVGSVQALSGDRYQVTFQLVGLFNQSAAPNSANSSVLAGQTMTVNRAGLRGLSHYISDVIYEKLTGVRGIFSTEIAYILMQRNASGLPARYVLEVADMDGFNPRPLLSSSQPIMSPTWSANGQSVAYVSFENQQPAIYMQDVSSGQRHLVSSYPGINGAPAFSPDGRSLALVLTLSGNPKIYTFSLSSHKFTDITHGYSLDTEPAWSADGRSLLYTSDSGGTPQIYRYDFANGQTQRITFDGDYNARASFFPNGKGIVMMHRTHGVFGIAREDFDTGRVQVLTQTGADESPSLAPNGKMVIYATKDGGRGVLSVVSIDGRIKLKLPAREGDVREPAWSPFMNGRG